MSNYYASKIVEIAKAEVGYLEKKSNANLDSKTANAGAKNFDKYARDLDKVKWFNGAKNGYDWCTSFVSWLFYQLAGKDVAKAKAVCYQPTDSSKNYAASCTQAVKYYKNNKAFFTTPKIGDQIFFNWKGDKNGALVNHTGLVTKVDGTKVYTIEGNSKQSGREGVFEHSYALNYNCIVGYGRPKYDTEPVKPNKPVVTFEPYKVKVTAKDGLNIRTGAGTSYAKLGAMPKNTVITVTKVSNGWGYGTYGKIKGWFSLQWTTRV